MIVMGHVVNAYGIRGWIRVHPYTETVDGLLDYKHWWLGKETTGDWREIQLVEGHPNGKLLDAKLLHCDDRDQALRLKNLQIAVPRDRLPKLPENGEAGYYWSDLVGSAVSNVNNERLGTVTGLLETGLHDVLCIQDCEDASKELLIPFIAERFIKHVDLANRKIVVDWERDY